MNEENEKLHLGVVIEPLPCPFCKNNATVVGFNGEGDYDWKNTYHEVRCTNGMCYLSDGAGYEFSSKIEAVTEWNKRN